jgi:hypothetical protein
MHDVDYHMQSLGTALKLFMPQRTQPIMNQNLRRIAGSADHGIFDYYYDSLLLIFVI